MSPNYTTILTPLDPDRVEACRKFLRENADPRLDNKGVMQCTPALRFDKIPTLHFCSFIILDGEDEFAPRLVFEATFDGSREDFLSDLLRVAPSGMRDVYSHCAGFSATALAAPEIMKEYLISHDIGANTFFSGSPGRTVAQIRGENRIRGEIIEFLSHRWPFGEPAPARSKGILDAAQRDVIRGVEINRWAEQPAQIPWEIQHRDAIVVAAMFAAFVIACGIGLVVGMCFGFGPFALHRFIVRCFEQATLIGGGISTFAVAWLPWLGDFIKIQPVILDIVIGLSGIWLIVRIAELFLSGASTDPRAQSFILRFPLQLLIVIRYALLLFLGGAVLLAIVSGMTSSRTNGVSAVAPDFLALLWLIFTTVLRLIATIGVLLVLDHWATTLKLAVEVRRLDMVQENSRRLKLDLCRFAMFLTVALSALIIVRHLPLFIGDQIATIARTVIYAGYVIVGYALIGILTVYAIAFLLFVLIISLETKDKSDFRNPAALSARARENAKKFAREEGGINAYQNHLVSITRVKPGFARLWLLRLALLAVDVLSRFWFNRGELGGIPTILSARWVLIDGGRRLLFLDNYGGAWESYLNEFIDMPAVKGLNAIWSNTFVKLSESSFGFPATRFLFWQGAQDERPFKAYVRQSQVETLAWYGAYRTLSVVNINTNTELRQSLSKPLTYGEVDRVFQNL